MIGCVLSQLKPSDLYKYLAMEKASAFDGLLAFSTAKNVEVLGFYPIYSIPLMTLYLLNQLCHCSTPLSH